MCALSNRIREKPDWWEKMDDEAIAERWRGEALQQGEDDEQPAWNLTPGMVSHDHVFRQFLSSSTQHLKVKYVFEELEGYAALRDPETGIEARFSTQCAHADWTNITSDFRLALQNASGGLTNLSQIPCERSCSRP